MGTPSIEDRVAAVERDVEAIKGAFMVKNGRPDYAGHNFDHEFRSEQSRNFAEYKVEATKNFIKAVVVFLAAVFGYGLIEYAKKALGIK